MFAEHWDTQMGEAADALKVKKPVAQALMHPGRPEQFAEQLPFLWYGWAEGQSVTQ